MQQKVKNVKVETQKREAENFPLVRLIGLEPTRRETPDPKSGASTNFATGADSGAKIQLFLLPAAFYLSFFQIPLSPSARSSLRAVSMMVSTSRA